MKVVSITGNKTLMEKTVNGKTIEVRRSYFRGFQFDCIADGYCWASFSTEEQAKEWFKNSDHLIMITSLDPVNQISYRELMGL